MFIGEEDGDPDGRLPFIGRLREREEIKTILKKRRHRLVQISGALFIGKQRLVNQICEELKLESDKYCKLHVISISCKSIRTTEELVQKMVESLHSVESNDPLPGTTNKHVLQKFISKKFRENDFLLSAFTKLDDFLFNVDIHGVFEKFLELCSVILQNSRNTFIIVSSQTRLNLNVDYTYRHVLLPKLTVAEATCLLFQSSPDVDYENTEKDIVNGCHCVPGLILNAASIMVSSEGIVKPRDLVELLKSPHQALDFFSSHLGPNEEDLRNKIEKLLKRLPTHLQTSIQDIMLLQGSFSSDAIAAVLGCRSESETTVRTIIPLRDSSILEFNKDTQTFSINPLLRAYFNEVLLVCSSDLARLRFVKFFADVMVTVDQKLYQTSHKSAQQYFHYDYENVSQLMQQAMHCNEDIFAALMEAVSGAEELFIKCFPVEKVKDFYYHLLKAAEMYGKQKEIAILKMFLAQSMTQLKVDTNREEITRLFREAYDIYKTLSSSSDPGYHHMTLLGFMGRFIIRQGKYRKGLGYVEKALNMKVKDDRTRVFRRKIEFLVQQSLGEMFTENYEKAEEVLNQAHDLAQKEAPFHEAVAIILNTFGLICDRSGRDENKALQWYKASLTERRKYEQIAPEMLVPTLNNIANHSVKRGNYGYAKKLTEEALMIRKRCGWRDYYTGLTLRQKAENHLVEGQVQLAINVCDEALAICKECTPSHFFLNEIRLLRLHCHLSVNDIASANKIYSVIIEDKERYRKDTDRGEQTMSTMLHSLLLSEDDAWDNSYNGLQEEIRLLRDRSFECFDFDKYHQLQIKINTASRLFTSKREDSKDIHRKKCWQFVIMNCNLCQLKNCGVILGDSI